MTAPTQYKPYAILLNSSVIGYIQDFTADPGLTAIFQTGDGQYDPSAVFTGSQAPTFGFTTQAIATALAACGIGGAAVASGNVLTSYFQKVTEGSGTRTSGANHVKAEMNQGFLYPVSLSAGLTPHATISYACALAYDGTNAPIKFTASQSLTGALPSGGESFVAGGMKTNVGAIAGVSSLNINFGISPVARTCDGDIYPTWVGGDQRQTVISVATSNIDYATTMGIAGAAIGAGQTITSMTFYLRKRAHGGGNVANETTQHISIVVNEGMIVLRPLSAQESDFATTAFDIYCSSNGTDLPLVISTGVAIT